MEPAKVYVFSAGREMDALPVPVPETKTRDWSELPLDALSVIFSKLGSVEILMGAGLVCHSWLHAAKLPALWRSVRILRCIGSGWNTDKALAVAKAAVDRSDGQLELFETNVVVPDELLKSPSLKSLSLRSCYELTKGGFITFIRNCPLLEDLFLDDCMNLNADDVWAVTAITCPQLKRLRCGVVTHVDKYFNGMLGIATMHQLRHLTLQGIVIQDEELTAILDGCPHLEHPDISSCFCDDIDSALQAKLDRIKTLELPDRYGDYYDD